MASELWPTGRDDKREPWPNGTRENPLHFDSLESAFVHCRSIFQKVWAEVPGEPGVYEIYPGGRNVFWPREQRRAGAERRTK